MTLTVAAGAMAALAAIVVAAAALTMAPHGPTPLRNWPRRGSFPAVNATSVPEVVGSSSRSGRNTRGNFLTCKGALSRGKGVSDGPVQHPLGPPSLYGAGVHHLFWSTNAILIHVNVAVWRSAEIAAFEGEKDGSSARSSERVGR
jgi:hypothetical protein